MRLATELVARDEDEMLRACAEGCCCGRGCLWCKDSEGDGEAAGRELAAPPLARCRREGSRVDEDADERLIDLSMATAAVEEEEETVDSGRSMA